MYNRAYTIIRNISIEEECDISQHLSPTPFLFICIKFISIKRLIIPHRTIGGTIGYC